MQIDESKIEKIITNKTKALMIPNLIGNLPNWEKIKKIKNKYKLILIEDSADTLGATYNKKILIYADYAITSFYGSQLLVAQATEACLCLMIKRNLIKEKF